MTKKLRLRVWFQFCKAQKSILFQDCYYSHLHPNEGAGGSKVCLKTYSILLIELQWPENLANTYARYKETLESCFNLIRSHQQYAYRDLHH